MTRQNTVRHSNLSRESILSGQPSWGKIASSSNVSVCIYEMTIKCNKDGRKACPEQLGDLATCFLVIKQFYHTSSNNFITHTHPLIRSGAGTCLRRRRSHLHPRRYWRHLDTSLCNSPSHPGTYSQSGEQQYPIQPHPPDRDPPHPSSKLLPSMTCQPAHSMQTWSESVSGVLQPSIMV